MSTEAGTAGNVIELWRYPVAGLMGERLASARIGAGGLDGDRAVGLWDTTTERWLDAARCPSLRLGQARSEGPAVIVRLPDGTECVIGDPGTDAALSAWLDREVEARSDPAAGGDPAQPRVRVLSLSSVAALARHHPSGQWDARRFRPHVLVVVPGVDFGEDAWIGSEVRVGATQLAVDEATAVTDAWGAAQVGLAADDEIVTTIASVHDRTLGVTASVTRCGLVRLGDPVDPVPQ